MSESRDFFAHFSVLPDARVDRTKRHLLVGALFIAICTIICGGEGFTDMATFGAANKECLGRYLKLSVRPSIARHVPVTTLTQGYSQYGNGAGSQPIPGPHKEPPIQVVNLRHPPSYVICPWVRRSSKQSA